MRYNIFFFPALLLSCVDESKENPEEFISSSEIEIVDESFDIEDWANKRVVKKNDLLPRSSKIRVGNSHILIPTPEAFRNASKTQLGKNLYKILSNQLLSEKIIFIREKDFDNLNNKDFAKQWEEDTLWCGVRTMIDLENEDLNQIHLSEMLSEFENTITESLSEIEEFQKQYVEEIVENREDLGLSGDYQVLDKKILPPFDVEDHSFSMMTLTKTQMGKKQFNEILVQRPTIINQKLLYFYVTTINFEEVEYIKGLLKSWVQVAQEINQN